MKEQTTKPTNPALWIVFVIIILVLGAIGYFLFFQEEETNTNIVVVTNTTVNKNTNTLANNNTEIDTSDWKVYTNEKYGFSFQYPEDWILEKQTGPDNGRPIVSITSLETQQSIDDVYARGGYCEGCGPDISFYYYDSFSTMLGDNPNRLSASNLDEFIEEDVASTKLGVRTINGQEAIAVREGGFGVYYVLYIQKDGGEIYKIFVRDWDLQKYQLTAEEEKVISTILVIQ